MNDSTPETSSPKKETLHFLKVFARMYRPHLEFDEKEDEKEPAVQYPTAIC